MVLMPLCFWATSFWFCRIHFLSLFACFNKFMCHEGCHYDCVSVTVILLQGLHSMQLTLYCVSTHVVVNFTHLNSPLVGNLQGGWLSAAQNRVQNAY